MFTSEEIDQLRMPKTQALIEGNASYRDMMLAYTMRDHLDEARNIASCLKQNRVPFGTLEKFDILIDIAKERGYYTAILKQFAKV
jgi:hypothetical protein